MEDNTLALILIGALGVGAYILSNKKMSSSQISETNIPISNTIIPDSPTDAIKGEFTRAPGFDKIVQPKPSIVETDKPISSKHRKYLNEL